MTQPFSFPYPELGTVVRPAGQGCSSCVHSTYCMALYWFRRGGDSRGFHQQPVDDPSLGRACSSWSSNPSDIVTSVNQRDRDEEEYMWRQGIGSEANRNGITEAVTGSNRRP
jgi:hypothetical protein